LDWKHHALKNYIAQSIRNETGKEEVKKKKSHKKLHIHFHYSLEQYNDDFVFLLKKT